MSSHPNIPNFYYEKPTEKEHRINTNPRYRFFRQMHFTAGDTEQFMQHWRTIPYSETSETLKSSTSSSPISFPTNIPCLENWPVLYKTLSPSCVTNTFHYLFHMMKKGIFVSIRNHQLEVFLPFSKIDYQNQWGPHLHWNRSVFPTLRDLFLFVCVRSNIPFSPKRVHADMKSWYANNGLVRYEYPPTEGDSGVNMIHDMLLSLCASDVSLPDIDFFINKRDFPLLRRDRKHAYENLFKGIPVQKIKHSPWDADRIDNFAPILSMTTSKDHADLPVPTWEDWTRASYQHDKRIFSREFREYPDIPSTPFRNKIPTAIFRGGSTGLGVSYRDNPRLFFSKLSLKQRKHPSTKLPYLDCGITKWNLRPRKKDNFLDTIPASILDELPLVNHMGVIEQSRFKYILHLPGHSCAYRLAYELSMNSVIILYPCKYSVWYTSYLQPYVHYVPILQSEDGKVNIYRTLDWCIANEQKCEEIASNARKFYDEYLGCDGIFRYWSGLLHGIHKNMGGMDSTTSPSLSLRAYQYSWQKTKIIEKKQTICSLLEKECTEIVNFLRQATLETWKQELHRTYCDKNWYNVLWMALEHYQPSLMDSIENMIQSLPEEKTSPRVQIWKWCFGNQIFCCKRRIPSALDEEAIHEMYVHTHLLPTLKNKIPNFAHMYACLKRGLQIMEWVEGPSLALLLSPERIRTAKDALFRLVDIVKQLCLALEMAQQYCGFMHMDLYPWNIIISILSTPRTVRYEVGEKVIECKSRHIPVMIDMAKSFVVDGDGHVSHCVEPFLPSRLHDLKCIVYSSLNLILSNYSVQQDDCAVIVQLMSYFETEQKLRSFSSPTKFNVASLKRKLQYEKKFSVVLFSDTQSLPLSKTPLDFFDKLQAWFPDLPDVYEIRSSNLLAAPSSLPLLLHSDVFGKDSSLSIMIRALPWYSHHCAKNTRNVYLSNLTSKIEDFVGSFDHNVHDDIYDDVHTFYYLCLFHSEHPEYIKNLKNLKNLKKHVIRKSEEKENESKSLLEIQNWKIQDCVYPIYSSHPDKIEIRQQLDLLKDKAIEAKEIVKAWKEHLERQYGQAGDMIKNQKNITNNDGLFSSPPDLWSLHLASAPVFYMEEYLEYIEKIENING